LPAVMTHSLSKDAACTTSISCVLFLHSTSLGKKKMKKLLLLTFLASIFQKIVVGQISLNSDLPRGHYKQLNTYSWKANGDNAIDTLLFIYDEVLAQKRLSLKPHYLTTIREKDFTLPDVPANSAAKTRAELNYLLTLQQQRTELDVKTSLFMANVYYNPRAKPEDVNYQTYRDNLFFIGRSIGTWFNAQNLPQTADLMANVWQDASYFIWFFKYKFARVRPYILEPALDNLEETNWPAYPSGHAANSYINAYVYSVLAPAFSDVFLKDAYDMAHSREILGVHFPSDSECSRLLSQQFVNLLFKNKEFLKDFAKVKDEWQEKAKEDFIKPSSVKKEKNEEEACAKKCDG
jgi:acid phosphatase (class A)